MQVPPPAKLNGLDVQTALETIAAVKADPTLAQFQFRVANRWVDGTENRSTIQGFYGAGQEDPSRSKPFEYVHDEPPVLLGNNLGANPGESLLHALAGCITTTLVLHAMARGIVIRRLSTEIHGDVDIRGVLGIDESVNPGFQQIRVRLNVEADCSDEELEKLILYTQERSTVTNTIRRPTPVVLERLRKTSPAGSEPWSG
jgi:uncharacterized OsmC-like protein